MKPMTKGLVVFAATSVLMAGSVSAKTTLNFMVKLNMTKEWKNLFDTYQKLHPDVEIKPVLQNLDWPQYYEKIVVMQAAGAALDLVMVDRQAVPYIKKGTFMDLAPYIKSDKIRASDYPDVAWKQYRVKGQQVAFPLTSYPGPMFWNRDLFAQAGLTGIPQDWKDKTFTTDVFAMMVRKLTRDIDGDGKKDVYGTSDYSFGSIMASFGAEWVDFDKDKVTANSKQMVDAWTYWYHLRDDLRVVADGEAQKRLGINWDWFSSGKIGAMTSGSWAMSMYTNSKFKWDLGVTPIAARRATTATVDGLAIAGNSKNKAAAWDFIKWIGTDRTGSALLGDAMSGIPTLKTSVPRYIDREQKNYPKVNMEVLRDSLDYSDIEGYNLYSRSKEIESAIWSTMEMVDKGTKSLKAALDMIQDKVSKLID